MVLAALLGACRGGPRPSPEGSLPAGSRRGGPAAARGGRTGGNRPASPLPVDSVAECPAEALAAVAAFRSPARVFQFGPLCTTASEGRWAAVLATGTREEASDLWVLVHGDRDQVHRVRRFPVGVRIEFGQVTRGWAYLLGRTNALDDMPAGGRVLAVFPIPAPGDGPPELRTLGPLEVPLLRATDARDLDLRLAAEVPPRDPSAQDAQRTVEEVTAGGAPALRARILGMGTPTLRAWQVGVYQETAFLLPRDNDDAATGALELLRALGASMDCAAGERCIARPTQALAAGTTGAQALLRYQGERVTLAALLAESAAPTAVMLDPGAPWSAEALDRAEDLAAARQLCLDGAVGEHVVSASRGDTRVLAFSVTVGAEAPRTRVYLQAPGHAPRAYGDDSIGVGVVGPRELHLRDYDLDGGLELVTLAQREGAAVTSIASFPAVSSVSQHDLVHRHDMLRIAFGATTVALFDEALRSFRPAPSAPLTACGLLDRLAGNDPRALLGATGSTFVVVRYREPDQPLRGEPQRISRRELQEQGSALLGRLAGLRCPELSCDWEQSVCRAVGDPERGVFWFAEGGRRLAAVSRFEAP